MRIQKMILPFFSFLILLSCEKKTLRDKINGTYVSTCRYVEYEIGNTGYIDSTVFNRTFVIEIFSPEVSSVDRYIHLQLPSLFKSLKKVESNRKNVVRYEDYFDPTPDGETDTLSVEINTKTQELDLRHVGYTKYFFDNDTVFTTVDYLEICNGVKLE